MTLDRYKFLSALVVLRDDFSVGDVVRFTNMPKTTIATFLNRESRFVERAGSHRTGKRGGQIAKYRVRPDQVDSLEAETARIEADSVPGSRSPDSNIIASLLVADNTINRLAAVQSEKERKRITDVAQYLIDTAADEIESLEPGPPKAVNYSRLDSLRQRLTVQELNDR